MFEERRRRKSWPWIVLLTLLLFAAIGVVVWLQIGAGAPDTAPTPTHGTSTNSSAAPSPSATPSPEPMMSASDRQNVAESISSGNTAALEGYLANPVDVLICASGGIGSRTPEQAVGDLAYLNGSSAVWDFALDAPTIASYQASSYAQYFPDRAIVGRTSDNWVITLVPVGAKIGTILMCNAEELITG